MPMITIRFIQPDGAVQNLEAEPGQSLMKAAIDADVKNMALHYALQKPAPAKTPSTGDAAAGKAASAACFC